MNYMAFSLSLFGHNFYSEFSKLYSPILKYSHSQTTKGCVDSANQLTKARPGSYGEHHEVLLLEQFTKLVQRVDPVCTKETVLKMQMKSHTKSNSFSL